MGALGENVLGTSDLPPFFKVQNAQAVKAPENRKGDALRTYVRSLSGFQKEALVRSAKTGDTWRLVSDEGPYLDGYDVACCPLAFLSVGMVASFMNEILAYATQQNVEIRKLKLTQNNYYTMKGSMPRRTMVGGAENIELEGNTFPVVLRRSCRQSSRFISLASLMNRTSRLRPLTFCGWSMLMNSTIFPHS